MRSNLEAAMRASGRPRQALERLECQQTCFIMAPKTGSKKLVETWRPERDLDCSTTIQDTANLTELAYSRLNVTDPLGWDVLDALELLSGFLEKFVASST